MTPSPYYMPVIPSFPIFLLVLEGKFLGNSSFMLKSSESRVARPGVFPLDSGAINSL
jgi:hypothetical protein